jgi:hypothetical protein
MEFVSQIWGEILVRNKIEKSQNLMKWVFLRYFSKFSENFEMKSLLGKLLRTKDISFEHDESHLNETRVKKNRCRNIDFLMTKESSFKRGSFVRDTCQTGNQLR